MPVVAKKKALAVLLIGAIEDRKEKRKKRQVWAKSWLMDKEKYSDMRLLKELRDHHASDYRNYLRMDDDTFNYLLEKVEPLIRKKDTNLRNAITAEQRLVATLRYLATGRTLEDLKFSTIISPQALGHIIPETCEAIYHVLKDEYLKMPSTTDEWKAISNGFYSQWNFPNCGGAVDGKHVAIMKPPNSGSYFYNYKGYFSIVLLGIVDANLEFIYADVGQNGRISDGGVIENTMFYKKLKCGGLNVPKREESTAELNFVFVGDEAFSLREDFLKPYPQKGLTYDQRIFNYRLSRARRVVENAFGLLSSKFRIFHSTITMWPNKVDHIVMACVVLHNFMRRRCGKNYIKPTEIDIEDPVTNFVIPGDWRKTPLPSNAFQNLAASQKRHASEKAKIARDAYKTYFTTIGQVAWQDRLINEGALAGK